jgi:hypothetical protein
MTGVAIRVNNIYYIAENQNIIGRTDLHMSKDDTVYVLEAKVNDKADNAIKQIKEKYGASYRDSFSEVVKIGINWDQKKKKVDVALS